MSITFTLALLLAVFSIIVIETDAFLDLLTLGMGLIFEGVRKGSKQRLNPPSNRDDSIRYLLYTPFNKDEPCLIQPNPEQFDRCAFNANLETKYLIHGFIVHLNPGNLINIMKDALLEHDDYNVVLVDWTIYSTMPFHNAFKNSLVVGEKVGEMMAFIQSHAKVSPKTFHCIGHSLGVLACSLAGRSVRTLGRITGLDPEGVSLRWQLTPNLNFNYTDADFVDIIHTSNTDKGVGVGIVDAVGHLDFYPNGGEDQPPCDYGNTYKISSGQTFKVRTSMDKIICNHHAGFDYYTNSIMDGCQFTAIQCQSYLDFIEGHCSSGTKAQMGFHAKKIPGIPPNTKFYLNTSGQPYCKDVLQINDMQGNLKVR